MDPDPPAADEPGSGVSFTAGAFTMGTSDDADESSPLPPDPPDPPAADEPGSGFPIGSLGLGSSSALSSPDAAAVAAAFLPSLCRRRFAALAALISSSERAAAFGCGVCCFFSGTF